MNGGRQTVMGLIYVSRMHANKKIEKQTTLPISIFDAADFLFVSKVEHPKSFFDSCVNQNASAFIQRMYVRSHSLCVPTRRDIQAG